jgi:adenylylsulfate kinase
MTARGNHGSTLEETPVKAGKVSTETSSPTVRNYSGTPALRIAHPERHALLGHRSAVLWLTGLSGAGKSTLATALERRLVARGVLATVIDGDLLRSGLSRDLGYAPEDRRENLRRATELALHLSAAGLVVIVALISPSRADRSEVARRMKETGIPFAEVFINTPLTVCERRDPKGLYRRARIGEIRSFTGLDSAYEPPLHADLELHPDLESIDQSVEKLLIHACRLSHCERPERVESIFLARNKNRRTPPLVSVARCLQVMFLGGQFDVRTPLWWSAEKCRLIAAHFSPRH